MNDNINASIKKRYRLKNKYLIMLFVLCTCLTVIALFGASYAFLTSSKQSKEYVVNTGTLQVVYKKKSNVINLDNLYPMTDQQGLALDYHEFTVTNNGTVDARYLVRLELSDTGNMISPKYIKVSYSKNDGSYSKPVLLSDLNESLVLLDNQQINKAEVDTHQIDTYRIKLWIDISAPNDMQGKHFEVRVIVDSIQDTQGGYDMDTKPVIYLQKDTNGNTDIHLKKNELYNELGIEKVVDDKDNISINNVLKSYEYYDGNSLSNVDSIDTSKIGIYYITYSVADSSNNTSIATRVVTVSESGVVPNISLKGNSVEEAYLNQEYIELGVIVDDNNQVINIGEVKTSMLGSYTIRYIVVDSDGNINSVVRTVNVVDANLNKVVLYNNKIIETPPDLTKTSEETQENGLFVLADQYTDGGGYLFF